MFDQGQFSDEGDDHPGQGRCARCGGWHDVMAGGRLRPHEDALGRRCAGSRRWPDPRVRCPGCGRDDLSLYWGGYCCGCYDAGARLPAMTGSEPDPIVTVRITMAADPGADLYGICRRSAATRLAGDAEPGSEVTDLGIALALCGRYEHPERRAWLGASLLRVGVARDGEWAAWFLPSFPAEPVPGTPPATAARN